MIDEIGEISGKASIQELFLTIYLLKTKSPSQTFQRWIEYRAYVDFVEYLTELDELPEEYASEVLNMEEISNWLSGSNNLPFSFKNKLEHLLYVLTQGTGDVIEELCNFYCEYKKKIAFGTEVGAAILTAKGVAEFLLTCKIDFFIGGIPITTFASLLIKSGVLDEYCKCKDRE